MNFTPSGIFASLVFGAIGLWMFNEGRRQHLFYRTIAGVLLMTYPSFTSTPIADWGVGVFICAGVYIFKL